MSPALHGLLTGLTLIIAIGSQNVFVLRQGLRREHVLPVVLVCLISDVVLIVAGASGLGALVRAVPEVVDVARWVGVVFLLGYAALAARRAVRGGDEGLEAPGDGAPSRGGLGAAVGTALALTWLNPHVYLDTVLLLGSVAATHGEDADRFAAGAILGSALWFGSLGFGARRLSRFLRSPRSWRILDGAVAVTMVLVAGALAVG